jgi:hypothetical protein
MVFVGLRCRLLLWAPLGSLWLSYLCCALLDSVGLCWVPQSSLGSVVLGWVLLGLLISLEPVVLLGLLGSLGFSWALLGLS